MEWPEIGLSPINEYNTEGLFDMAFPTLFPMGNTNWFQPCLKDAHLHEYGLHLLKYCDQRFGKHPRFWYFVLNMIMRHRIQGTTIVFMKKHIEDGIPSTIEDLCKELYEFPNTKLAEQLMCFGSCIQ